MCLIQLEAKVMAETQHLEESEEQQVTPWKAQAAKGKSTIDYDKLIGELE